MFEQRDIDSAYSMLLVDVLERMLERAGDPAQTASALSEQMRELTGARLVAVLRHDPQGSELTFAAYPDGRKAIAESPEARNFFTLAARIDQVTLWDTGTHDPVVEKLLSSRGLANIIGVPLVAGNLRVGTLIILDASLTGNLSSLLLTLERISRVMGLIIRNAGFYQEANRQVQLRASQLEEANLALRESEEKFRVLADTISAVIYVYQGENLVYVNNAAEVITGYSKNELLGMRFWDIIHPEFRELVRERGLARQRGEHIPSRYEVKLVTKAGEVRWAELTAGRIEYSGMPAGVATFFDITDRKRVEDELRKSEANLARAQKIGRLGNWEWDLSTGQVYGSVELYRLFGIDPDVSRTIDTFLDRFPGGERERVKGALDAALAGSQPYYIDHRVVLPDGTERIMHSEAEVTRDSHGRPQNIFGVVYDITEQKRAQEVIVKERERFYTLLDSLPAFVYLQAPDHTIKFANSRFKELFGDPANRACYAVIQGYSEPCPNCPTLEALRIGEPIIWEWAANAGRVYQIYDYPFYDVDGSPLVLEMGIDITDRKLAEEALEESKAKTELYLDLMTHDIRNYNQQASGFLELVLDTMSPEDANRELLLKPLVAIQSSSNLIDNVVKLQKVTNREQLPGRTIDLCDVLARVKSNFEKSGDRQVKIYLQPTSSCTVIANELIYDVFSNIVSNAIKHSAPDRSPVIDIRLELKSEADGMYIKVTLDDNGPGIPDDVKQKLFQRYARGRSRARGRGLGLYLVRTLVESSGGRVWVEDRVPGDPGKGARFVVMLPATATA